MWEPYVNKVKKFEIWKDFEMMATLGKFDIGN